MRYVLDTNIILTYLRKHNLWNNAELPHRLFDQETDIFIPAVVIGELKSIAIQNNWGEKKSQALEAFIRQFIIIDRITDELILAYAEIDAYSQGRMASTPLTGSARNMGKNDLWIAATARVLAATLITTDKDFQHLHSHFLEVTYFELNT